MCCYLNCDYLRIVLRIDGDVMDHSCAIRLLACISILKALTQHCIEEVLEISVTRVSNLDEQYKIASSTILNSLKILQLLSSYHLRGSCNNG